MRTSERYSLLSVAAASLMGGGAALLYFLWPHESILFPESWSGIVVYTLAIVCPRVLSLSAMSAYLMVSLVFSQGELSWGFLRVTIFAIVLLISQTKKSPYSPIFVLAVLWQMSILSPLFFASTADGDSGHVSPQSALSCFTELSVVFFAWFIACSPSVHQMLGKPRFGTKSFLFHILLLPLFAFCGSLLFLEWWWSPVSLSQTLSRLGFLERRNLLGYQTLFLSGMLLSKLLASAVQELITFYIEAAKPGPKKEEFLNVPFVDAQEIGLRLWEQSTELYRLRTTFAELQNSKDHSIEELPNIWAQLEQAELAFQHLPLAVLGVQGNGQIIAFNKAFAQLLCMPENSLRGRHYRVLEGSTSPWRNELLQLIGLALQNSSRFSRDGQVQSLLPSINGKYLDVRSCVAPVSRYPEAQNDKRRRELSHDLCVLHFIEVKDDIRMSRMSLLLPTEAERLGTLGVEYLNEFEQALQVVLEKHARVFAALKKLAGVRGAYLQEQEIATVELTEAERTLREISDGFGRFLDRSTLSHRGVKRINLTAMLDDSLRYLTELLGISGFVPMLSGSEQPLRKEVFVELPLHEVYCFVDYLLCFLRHIFPKAKELTVQLEYEELAANTAVFLTGASAGRYARLSFNHKGQSIPANVLSAQQELSSTLWREPLDSLEMALFLLLRQVRRFGGFSSLQSSSLKGTSMTLYLPVVLSESIAVRTRQIPESPSGTEISQANDTQVLIVGQDDVVNESLRRIIESAACVAIIRKPDELLKNLVSPIHFAGSGFEVSEEQESSADLALSGESESGQRRGEILQSCELVIFDGTAANFDTLHLIDELESENPHIQKILLFEASEQKQVPIVSKWILLKKPLDDQALLERVRECLRKREKIQELVAAPEKGDDFSGSGF